MVSFLDIFLVRHTMYTLYWLRHNVPFARSSFSILSVSCYRLLVVPRCTSIIKSQLKLAVSTDQHQRFGTTVINVATIPTIIKQRSLIILSHSWSFFKLSKCKAFFSRVFFLSTYGYSIFLTGNFVVVHLCKQQQHTAIDGKSTTSSIEKLRYIFLARFLTLQFNPKKIMALAILNGKIANLVYSSTYERLLLTLGQVGSKLRYFWSDLSLLSFLRYF